MADKLDLKKETFEVESLKRIAFFGIAVSTVATMTAVIAIPMLYNYMQHIQTSLQTEVDFCQHTANNLWQEYVQVYRKKNKPMFQIHFFSSICDNYLFNLFQLQAVKGRKARDINRVLHVRNANPSAVQNYQRNPTRGFNARVNNRWGTAVICNQL